MSRFSLVALFTVGLVYFISSVVASPVVPRDTPAIVSPAKGTSIAPGETFDFDYESIADYGESSYNLTIWLYTTPPSTVVITPMTHYAVGHYFGRFGVENYPGDPDPPNLMPSTLTMPNFSGSYGGFGLGSDASNQVVYLVVVEEWATGGAGTLGYIMSTTVNELIYNGTSSS